eukprot:TRINITY_DN2230_c0_g1_i1.p1 TRINITY_DN2230_c0_g1~~TRINITY_DN2230_c0_g1_i1.p1  ORF type:complete len:995 (-),score=230.32 TRINITY_DN2230_c0_g1_i1:22-2919(-)
MSSRFWLQPDEDEDLSQDEGLYSSDEDNKQEKEEPQGTHNKWEDSDEDDDSKGKRVVISGKQKKFNQITEQAKKLKTILKADKWEELLKEWEQLYNLVKKSTEISKDGLPSVFVSLATSIDDSFASTVDGEGEKTNKKLNKTQQKAFNRLKGNFKKLLKTDIQLAKEISTFREKGEPSDSEDWDSDIEDSNDKKSSKPKKNKFEKSDDDEDLDEPVKPKGKSKWEKSSDDDDKDDDDYSADLSSDTDDENYDKEEKKEKNPWEKADDKKKTDQPTKADVRTERSKKRKDKKEPRDQKGGQKKRDDSKDFELTQEKIDLRAKELLTNRGKKNYDRMLQVDDWEVLISRVKGDTRYLNLMFHLVDAMFDANPNMATHMSPFMWKRCYNVLVKILQMLQSHPEIKLIEGEQSDSVPPSDEKVLGNLSASVERLDDELTKSFQFIDPHRKSYLARLKDEAPLLLLEKALQNFYTERSDLERAATIAARRLDHIYYKLNNKGAGADSTNKDHLTAQEFSTQDVVDPDRLDTVEDDHILDDNADKTAAGDTKYLDDEEKSVELIIPEVQPDVDITETLESLCSLVYRYGDDRLKRRAMLMHIYHLAIHDEFFAAKDMLLMSHLQDTIQHALVPTQVLFNRAMVQLGLAAFRKGRVLEAHGCLSDICSQGKIKELLAQGINTRPHQDKTQEQEKQERRRQIPYHMYINIELAECVHLICAMLLEVPNMAAHAFEVKRKIISKHFRKVMDNYNRQVFRGPPENTREYVIASAKALSEGDWRKASQLLLDLEIWKLVPSYEIHIKPMLQRKIQEQGLRTYLYTYSQYYDSLSLEELSRMFELAPNTIHGIVSKMMISEQLRASWDQPTGCVVMNRIEPTSLQYLALQFAEKANVLVENNDSNESRTTFSYRDRWQQQGGVPPPGGQQNTYDRFGRVARPQGRPFGARPRFPGRAETRAGARSTFRPFATVSHNR